MRKKPVSPKSLANIQPPLPEGIETTVVRVTGKKPHVRKIRQMTSRDRGSLVGEALERFVQLPNGNWVVRDI